MAEFTSEISFRKSYHDLTANGEQSYRNYTPNGNTKPTAATSDPNGKADARGSQVKEVPRVETNDEQGMNRTNRDNPTSEVEGSDSQSKRTNRGARDPQSSSERGNAVPFLGKSIGSEHSKSEEPFYFPISFKFNIEYSPEQISRLLRKEEIQAGLRPKFMKELSTETTGQPTNICIRCRTCNAYVDFKCVNGKYILAVLRNKHTHQRTLRKPADKDESGKKKEMAPMCQKNISQTNFQTAAQYISSTSNVKTEMKEGVGQSTLKGVLDKMRSNIPTVQPAQRIVKDIQLTTAPRLGISAGFLSAQPTLITFNRFKAVEDLLLNNRHDLRVEQGREPPGSYPETMVVVSPTMKRNFERFGDRVNFHIVEQPILETSEIGHSFRLGVFTVLGYNRKMLMVGMTFLCRQTVAAARTMFEFFLEIHNAQKKQEQEKQQRPQSIFTTHSKEICLALNQLQEEGIYNGIHIIDPRHAIQSLENGLKVRNKVTRQIIDLCNKVVSERNKTIADKYVKEIKDLIETEDDQIKKVIEDFLNQREKICISSLPSAFLGISSVDQNHNKTFDEMLSKRTNSQGKPMDIESLCKKMLEFDSELLDQSFKKLEIYKDPIESVFDDVRVKEVRQGVETEVFKIFLQNYVEATCYNQVKQMHEGEDTIDVENTVTGQSYTLRDWNCSCDERKRTGIPCSHLLCVAIDTPTINYFQLISSRWRESEESDTPEEESQDLVDFSMQKESNQDNELRQSRGPTGSLKGSAVEVVTAPDGAQQHLNGNHTDTLMQEEGEVHEQSPVVMVEEDQLLD